MNWIALTESHLLKQLSATEVDLIKTTLLADAQADPVPDTLNSVTAEARGYVAGAGISLGPAGTIPDRIENHVISRAVVLLIDRVPMLIGSLDPEESRRKRSTEALSILRDVQRGNFSIADPVTEKESNEAVTPTYRATRKRRYDRRSQDGI